MGCFTLCGEAYVVGGSFLSEIFLMFEHDFILMLLLSKGSPSCYGTAVIRVYSGESDAAAFIGSKEKWVLTSRD